MGQRTCSTWSERNLPWWPPFAAIVAGVLLLTLSAGWQASPSAAEPARPAEIEGLIKQLGSVRYEEREAASKALEEIGVPALDALLKAAADDQDAEVRKRAGEVAQRVELRMRAEVLAGVRKHGGRLTAWSGRHHLGPGLEIDLSGTLFADQDLATLRWLKDARILDLSGTRVTDAGLPHLRPLRELRQLGLRGTGVTDAGLAHLAGMDTLEDLDLSHTRVTDAAFAHLRGFPRLWSLNLRGTRVKGEGLAGLEELSCLDVADTPFTDAGLTRLKGRQNLVVRHFRVAGSL
jgi:hypothetical protein